uniref:Uncharacterized protein n=1 Tax=Graphocephala atropunctata TaxID=36148 RepID=A0A1B6LF13_9HEMI
MKRQLDKHTPGIFTDLHLNFYSNSNHKVYGNEETGDAKLLSFAYNSNEKKSITEQKKEFASYMKKKKTTLSEQNAGDLNVPRPELRWESEISINCDVDKSDSMADEMFETAGSDGDNFYQILQTRSSKAEETSSLLDQIVELRAELEERIKDLAIFKKEIHEVGKLMKIDLFQPTRDYKGKLEQPNPKNHQQTVALAERVLNSVQQTTCKIQNLCTDVDGESSS